MLLVGICQSPHSDYVTGFYYNVLSREVITAGSLGICVIISKMYRLFDCVSM